MSIFRLARRLGLVSVLAATSLAYAADPVRLTKEETQQALSGKSITYGNRNGNQVLTYFGPDGRLTQRSLTTSRSSAGTWTVEDDGRFCVKIISGTGADACRHLLRTDTGYAMSSANGNIPIDKMD